MATVDFFDIKVNLSIYYINFLLNSTGNMPGFFLSGHSTGDTCTI